jgi:hypothetical protein
MTKFANDISTFPSLLLYLVYGHDVPSLGINGEPASTQGLLLWVFGFKDLI